VGRRSCSFPLALANMGAYVEPCPLAAAPFAAASISCVPAYAPKRVVTANAQDGEQVNVSCPSTTMLFSRVIYAAYGTPSSDCNAFPRHVASGLEHLVLGKNSARFTVSWTALSLLADPCPDSPVKVVNIMLECLTTHALPPSRHADENDGSGDQAPVPPIYPLFITTSVLVFILYILLTRRRDTSQGPSTGTSRLQSMSFKMRGLPKSLSRRVARAILPNRFVNRQQVD